MQPMPDPFAFFSTWLDEATAKEPNDPNGVALATVGAAGMPSLRMVLLKGVDGPDRNAARGFVFYTNTQSRKGRQLAANPKAAMLFHWKSLRRQVRIEGDVVPVAPEEADAYFSTRARQSQLGAWASRQSEPLADRATLVAAVARLELKHALSAVPRPPHWSGFRIVPVRMEFWQDGAFRLHDRFSYEPDGHGGWAITRLYP